jgi:hypothetical protein
VSFTPFEFGGNVLGWLGLNPTVEAVTAQLLIIAFAVATYLLFRRHSGRTDAQRA